MRSVGVLIVGDEFEARQNKPCLHFIPAFWTAVANEAFSDRNPYPGWLIDGFVRGPLPGATTTRTRYMKSTSFSRAI